LLLQLLIELVSCIGVIVQGRAGLRGAVDYCVDAWIPELRAKDVVLNVIQRVTFII